LATRGESKDNEDVSTNHANDEDAKDEDAKDESVNGESANGEDVKNGDGKDEETDSKLVDPIRWYGILVPPALRTAQTQFVSAIEGPMPQVIGLSKDLRNLEIDIGRTRKAMKKLGKV
jgi:hypothetical protein